MLLDVGLDDWNHLFLSIRQNDWSEVLMLLKSSPHLAKTTIQMAGFTSPKVVSHVNALQLACRFPSVPARV
jgi:hypothetical protein